MIKRTIITPDWDVGYCVISCYCCCVSHFSVAMILMVWISCVSYICSLWFCHVCACICKPALLHIIMQIKVIQYTLFKLLSWCRMGNHIFIFVFLNGTFEIICNINESGMNLCDNQSMVKLEQFLPYQYSGLSLEG